MNKFKKISAITLGSIILFTATSFARTGKVNAPNTLILRKEASKAGEVITTIDDKTTVEILEESGEWYKVKYNNYEGYLFAKYVDAEKVELVEEQEVVEEDTQNNTEEPKEEEINQTETIQEEEKQYPQKQTVKADLKIYSIPSITAKTTGSVKKDEEITINYELNNWLNITYGSNTGWARKYFVNNENNTVVETNQEEKETPKAEEIKPQESKPIDNKKGYVDVSSAANIREQASTSSNIVNTLLRNTEVIIVAEEGDFYKIKYNDITGYIAKSLISEKPVADVTSRSSEERKTSEVQNTVENTENEPVATSSSSTGEKIVSFAKKYNGYTYTYGGTTPSTGFDCTGFTYYVYNACGVSLSRSFSVQRQSGTAVSKANLQPGDLLIFDNDRDGSPDHVGIYIGSGSFIHAENSRTGVKIDTVNSGHYNNCYYSARRVAN